MFRVVLAVSLHYLPPVSCLFTYLPVPPPTYWPAAYPLLVLTYFIPTDLPTYPPAHLTGLWNQTYLTLGIVFLSGEKSEVSIYQWRIQAPPLILDPIEARSTEKIFFELPPPLISGSGCLNSPLPTYVSANLFIHPLTCLHAYLHGDWGVYHLHKPIRWKSCALL